MDAREQDFAREGFRDVVVGAEFKAAHDVAVLALRGEDDDAHVREFGVRAHAAAEREAVKPRQHEVQQNELRAVAADGLKPLVAARGGLDVREAGVPQHHLQDGADGRVVFDDENVRELVHACLLPV